MTMTIMIKIVYHNYHSNSHDEINDEISVILDYESCVPGEESADPRSPKLSFMEVKPDLLEEKKFFTKFKEKYDKVSPCRAIFGGSRM